MQERASNARFVIVAGEPFRNRQINAEHHGHFRRHHTVVCQALQERVAFRPGGGFLRFRGTVCLLQARQNRADFLHIAVDVHPVQLVDHVHLVSGELGELVSVLTEN